MKSIETLSNPFGKKTPLSQQFWTKTTKLVLRELKKDIDYGRTIKMKVNNENDDDKNDNIVLSLKGGENKGIFIQIYNSATKEILLSELV